MRRAYLNLKLENEKNENVVIAFNMLCLFKDISSVTLPIVSGSHQLWFGWFGQVYYESNGVNLGRIIIYG